MKKKAFQFALVILLSASITGCKDKAKEANTGEAEAAAISKNTSKNSPLTSRNQP